MSPAPADPTRPLRIGAVTYLNTVPLVRGLREQLPAAASPVAAMRII